MYCLDHCRTSTGHLGIWDLASKRQIWTDEGKDQIMSIEYLHKSSKLLRYKPLEALFSGSLTNCACTKIPYTGLYTVTYLAFRKNKWDILVYQPLNLVTSPPPPKLLLFECVIIVSLTDAQIPK